MSAGGLSYSGLTTSRKTTLPSVEMWNTNMNILQDPNKGIFTRRIDKVGQTQGVLLEQDASGDRIAECINVYARGVNPMVSVSYDNYGNNAGARGSILNRGVGVKLPYRPEVFRPPVFRQEDLLPLSRLPRNYFYALTNPSFPELAQEMSCTTQDSSTRKDILHPFAPTPLSWEEYQPDNQREFETFHPRVLVDSPLQFSTQTNVSMPSDSTDNSGSSTTTSITKDPLRCEDVLATKQLPSKGQFHSLVEALHRGPVDQNPLHSDASTQYVSPYSQNSKENFVVDPKKVRSELLSYETLTNRISMYDSVVAPESPQYPLSEVHKDIPKAWASPNPEFGNREYTGEQTQVPEKNVHAEVLPVSGTTNKTYPVVSTLPHSEMERKLQRHHSPFEISVEKINPHASQLPEFHHLRSGIADKPVSHVEAGFKRTHERHHTENQTGIVSRPTRSRLEYSFETSKEGLSQRSGITDFVLSKEQERQRKTPLTFDSTTLRKIENPETSMHMNTRAKLIPKVHAGGFSPEQNSRGVISSEKYLSSPNDLPIENQWTMVKRSAYQNFADRFA